MEGAEGADVTTSALSLEEMEPTYLGPSWQRGEDGKFLLPERTLGWEILGWCATYLNNFDGSPGLRLTDEQARLILWWYALDDQGDWLNTRGVIQRLKGAGKDPLLAVIALVEWVGPCRFGGWDEDGSPLAVAHPNSWVQIMAVSKDQTKNTLTLLPVLMSDQLRATYQVASGLEILRANGGNCRLEAVTSSFRSLEGNRPTFQVFNETQHWVAGNGGLNMYLTAIGNANKMDSRYIAITNAYLPGEDSVAERMRGAWVDIAEGRAPGIGFMYDSIEAHPATPLTPEALAVVIPKIRGDAVWLKVETLIRSVLDTTISPARSRRMILNQIVADEDALLTEADWAELLRPGERLEPGDQIVLGFDGGKTNDSTALVAIRVSDGLIQTLLVEEKPNDTMQRDKEAPRWEVNRDKVDSAVHAAMARYDVVAFYADVAYWESYIAQWGAQYGHKMRVKSSESNAIGWDMRGSLRRTTLAHELLLRTILDRKLCHGGEAATPLNLTLRRHMLNARRRENDYGVSFSKESRDSPKKVDAYAALMLANTALNDYRQRGKKDKPRTGRTWFM